MSDTPADTPIDTATEDAAVKVWICPGCGARYQEPATCTNQHEPIETVAHDAPAEAAETAPEPPSADNGGTEPAGTDQGADEAPVPAEPVSRPAGLVASLHEAKAALEQAISILEQTTG